MCKCVCVCVSERERERLYRLYGRVTRNVQIKTTVCMTGGRRLWYGRTSSNVHIKTIECVSIVERLCSRQQDVEP